jgi:hypothetical protein
MARPKGTKYIETPDKMWEYFCKYAEQVKSNPRFKTQFVGRDGEMVKEPLERPLTMEGFSLWLFENDITTNLHDYLANTNDAYTDYSSICTRVREAIRRDQIEGGMVGQYNASITQRLNNLVDKQDITTREQPLFSEDV